MCFSLDTQAETVMCKDHRRPVPQRLPLDWLLADQNSPGPIRVCWGEGDTSGGRGLGVTHCQKPSIGSFSLELTRLDGSSL